MTCICIKKIKLCLRCPVDHSQQSLPDHPQFPGGVEYPADPGEFPGVDVELRFLGESPADYFLYYVHILLN